ncbi:DUF4381 domain-containing protein [uncultured Vibrio sp.]|uniref:DUF4381 domain-containing protein n=1 Tax=uncultured Vibrio sp. TaxID=114054 RepID=UPI0025D7396F|nr:DUF4381 domain-containing protein [uncultured Vibrio sp.]
MSIEHSPPSTYILRELHDITVPESISWMPQTVGWKVVAIVLVIGVFYTTYRPTLRWWNNRYRGEALAAMQAISIHDHSAPNQVFKVLKAVLRYIEPINANLFGHAFLKRLDSYLPTRHLPSVTLTDEAANTWMRSLESPSMRLDEQEIKVLIEYAKHWIQHHNVEESR